MDLGSNTDQSQQQDLGEPLCSSQHPVVPCAIGISFRYGAAGSTGSKGRKVEARTPILYLLGMRVVLLPLVLDKVSGTFSSGAHSTPVSQVTRSRIKKHPPLPTPGDLLWT